MTLKVYSVYDKKAKVYGTPFFQLNNNVALRSFTDLVNDGRSTVSKHPSDFNLECIGVFNDTDGKISAKKNEGICNGAAVKTQDDPRQTKMPFIDNGKKVEPMRISD